MGYKLIALDIDGTIRSEEHPVSERTRNAIARAMDLGATVTLATGRMFHAALPFARDLNITSPIITFQGAQIGDPITGKVLWHRPLTPAMGLAALEALAGWDREILAYHGDQVYANMRTPWIDGYEGRNQSRVHVADDLRPLAADGLTRLVIVGDEDDIHNISKSLKTRFNSRLNVTSSLPYFCEMLHPESGKHKALAWLCRHLGVRRSQTVAFGNGDEDVDMLRWAGLGVAVGGAAPDTLDAAGRVAPPIEEEGVAQVLEELTERGLIG
jgi:Cof subfamily protein (haloacid dehalogenase superfamily)